MSTLFSLKDKVAVITGSSRGIGRAIAEAMASAGAHVVISSRKEENCIPVADAIRARGGTAIAIPCNISKTEELETLISETERQLGTIDSLVLNAASNPVYGSMADVSDDAFNKIIGNNVRANMKLAHCTVPGMAKKGDGSIIIISSIAGLFGSKNLGVYAISKAADAQLARNLAVEWSPKGIRANCIAPGLIKTDFAKALWDNPDILDHMIKKTPMAQIGEPEDTAGIAVFLASRAARFITGQTIIADGGVTIADAF